MPVITVSGLHGTGKTTAARAIAQRLGLRYVCSGDIFRRMAQERSMTLSEFSRYVEDHREVDLMIERRAAEEAKRGNVVIDGRLSGWWVKHADLRILLTAPVRVRVRRICKREKRRYGEVLRETLERERSEARRFKRLYGIDVNDHSVFDLIMNTGRIPEGKMVDALEAAIRALL